MHVWNSFAIRRTADYMRLHEQDVRFQLKYLLFFFSFRSYYYCWCRRCRGCCYFCCHRRRRRRFNCWNAELFHILLFTWFAIKSTFIHCFAHKQPIYIRTHTKRWWLLLLFIVVCASINSTLSSIIIINVNMNKKKREHAPTAERVDDWVWCALATTTVAAFPMYICNWSSNHVCVFIHLFTTFAWCTFASSFINAKFHFNCPVSFFCFVFFSFFGTVYSVFLFS